MNDAAAPRSALAISGEAAGMGEGADAGAGTETMKRGDQGDLFGRGMIYVIIWSLQLVVSTFVSPVLTRVMPQEQFGVLASVIALYQLLAPGSLLGLDQALEIQRVEDGDDDRRSRGIFALGLIIAFGFSALCALTAPLWGPALGFGTSIIVFEAVAWTAGCSSVLLILAKLQAEDRLGPFALISITSTAFGVLLGLAMLFIFQPAPTPKTALVYSLGSMIAQYLALGMGLFWCRPRWAGLKDTETIRRAFALGIPLLLSSIAQFVLTVSDRLIIQVQLGEKWVAPYQVAYTVGNVTALMLTFTSRAWMPRLKSIVDDDERWRVIGRSRDGVYWLLGWVLLGVTVSAPFLLRLFAPESYDPAMMTPIVYVVGLGALPVAAAAATSQVLITTRNSRPIAWGAASAAIVKVVATLIGLHVLGLLGAGLATVIALVVQALVQRVAVSRRRRWQGSSSASLAFLAAVVVLAGISTLLPQTPAWNIGRFAFSCCCVPFFFYALRGLRTDSGPLPGLRKP